MERWSGGLMRGRRKELAWQNSSTPLLQPRTQFAYDHSTRIKIEGRRRRARVHCPDERWGQGFARRFERKECDPLLLSKGRHAWLHEGGVRVSRSLRRTPT